MSLLHFDYTFDYILRGCTGKLVNSRFPGFLFCKRNDFKRYEIINKRYYINSFRCMLMFNQRLKKFMLERSLS